MFYSELTVSYPKLSYFTLNISKYTKGDLEDLRVSIDKYKTCISSLASSR